MGVAFNIRGTRNELAMAISISRDMALTSYAPPNDEAAPTNVILDPTFGHQLRDLSIMPYNPHLDIPIFLDLPLTGGSAAKSILGNCLKMIQCTNQATRY